MSTIYVLEPPTKGKVILNTTYGPIDIELWPKEAPKAVRNFVQLCMEGYYDHNIFHRIIKGFMVQAGDPTGTGTGGESIYGGYFSDEFHSRLRFKHRGLVACANAGSPNTNGSQFFISLDKCDWLDKKNTIFGKVTGDSIYNLLRLGEIDTDQDDRPTEPPKILSVEVLWNPFEDIVPRVSAKPVTQSASEKESKDLKRKAVKNLNLLSFGEEAEEEEKEVAIVKQKIRSSHDVLDDPRLLREEVLTRDMNSSEAQKAREMRLSVREALTSKKEESNRNLEAEIPSSIDDSDDDEARFDARMRQQILKKRMEMGDHPTKQKLQKDTRSTSPKGREMPAPRSNVDSSDDDRPKVEKLSLKKKKGLGSEARAERMVNANADLQLLDTAERGRQLAKLKKRRLQGREDDKLAKLEKFKASLSAKQADSSSEVEKAHVEDLSDWKSVKLKFTPELDKDQMSRRNNPNDYVVVDPLLEKGKEKFNKMQAKMKRKEREWAGRSLT